MKKINSIVLVTILSLFGFLTLFLSTSVILDLFGIREKEWNFIMFIVWANFLNAIIYLLSAYGIMKNKKWSTSLLSLSTIILLTALVGLFVHISLGGVFEIKTVYGMIFRTLITLIFTISSFILFKKRQAWKKL